MEEREIAEVVEKQPYFEAVAVAPALEQDDGTREMGVFIEYWFLLHFVDDTKLIKSYGKVAGVLAPYLKPCFQNPEKPLKKLLKKEEYLKDASWVENLCSGGKLALAIERAEKNIEAALAVGELDKHSYSYVYKMFKRN